MAAIQSAGETPVASDPWFSAYGSAMANVPSGDSPDGAALFEAANKLRGSVESAEYKHLVLGLIFLKYDRNGRPRRSATYRKASLLIIS